MLEKSVNEIQNLALEIAEIAEANRDFLEYKLIHIYVEQNAIKPELPGNVFFVWEIPAGRRLISYTKRRTEITHSGISDFDFPKSIFITTWNPCYSSLSLMYTYSLDSRGSYLPRWQTNIMSRNRICLGVAGKTFYVGESPSAKTVFHTTLDAVDTWMKAKMYDDDIGYVDGRFVQLLQEYHGIEFFEQGKISINPISLLEVADGKTLDWDGCFDAYVNKYYPNVIKSNSYWKQQLWENLYPVVDNIPENLVEHLQKLVS